jgi:hypothetical protein
VLKKELFFDYCEFLFGILNDIDAQLDTSDYSINGQRTLGYLGEILFDTYFYKLLQDKNINYKELGMTFIGTETIPTLIEDRTAIVLLAYADFESLEISLAVYSKFIAGKMKLFILQNGRGTYDCERTYAVAKRYQSLYPENIVVVDDIPPQKPYTAIQTLLDSKRMDAYDYICKVDDDAFPLTPDWFNNLCATYETEFAKHGNNLAYVSALVNNNPFGFKQLINNNSELADEYFGTIARKHVAGIGFEDGHKMKSYPKWRIVDANEIDDGVCGTIWRYSYIARWVHEKTTLQPEKYIKIVKDWDTVEVGQKRYSINCMLFKKSYWNDIADPKSESPADDEFLSEQYCKKNGKIVMVNQSIPFVHLFFFSQRAENRNMVPAIRQVYEKWLKHPYPITMQPDKNYENEDRLKFLELEQHRIAHKVHADQKQPLRKRVKNGIRKVVPEPARPYAKRAYQKARNIV